MSQIFFTSDTHFGHSNIIKYSQRPFRNAEEMDNILIDNINNMVDENDTLYHLGDFMYGVYNDTYQRAAEYRNRINCRNIFLVWGNHDKRNIGNLFKKTYDKYELYVDSQLIVLDHYANAVYNKSHKGAWHLYGHSHGGAETWLDKKMPGRRSMDVGVDNIARVFGDYGPVSLEEVSNLMKDRPGFSIDHHKPSA